MYIFQPEGIPDAPVDQFAFPTFTKKPEDATLVVQPSKHFEASNPEVAKAIEETYHHSEGGGDEFPAKNDRGYDWWTTDGKLVLEDPTYCADVSFTVGSWIDIQDHYSAGEE